METISKIKYLLVLVLLVAIPMQANAGFEFPLVNQTDTATNRLTYFWDLRDRESFLQLTNVSTDNICVHVQIFNVNGDVACEEVNFNDCYTANDTHVYDVRNLTKNDGLPAPTSDFTDGYGFAVISTSSSQTNGIRSPVLIGMFRVVDDLGYEYRANAAGERFNQLILDANKAVLPFNDINGNNMSDVVGIIWEDINSDTVHSSSSLTITYGNPNDSNLIFDEFENPQSCSSVTFACAPGKFIYGVDNSLPPSKGGNEICNASTLNANNTAGWLSLPFEIEVEVCEMNSVLDSRQICGGTTFVGFLGLNNGDGTGSMDSWWSVGQIVVF